MHPESSPAAANWSRRAFLKSAAAGTALAAGAPLWLGQARAADSELTEGKNSTLRTERYRAVSWWLVWDDLAWPNGELIDKVRRRADVCAANGVNCCIIFGAHFRWDFMPLWPRLHDEMRFIADELHQRRILLFDHHSSVLTHRPRTREDALSISRRNRHHVPFYPSREEAATWQFNGSRLNDWRMIDVESGEVVYLPTYNAEQFCMNNPAFRSAYAAYIRKLRAETGIDGLMSDDGIFYADWRACGCKYCRKRFARDYSHKLPPTNDATFWGNRASRAFRDWIEMRFRSSGDFLEVVKEALPAGFPLLTCCASSESSILPAYGMSYQDFIHSCNHVLLEMCGSTPTLAGTWDDRIPSQLLHLSIARDYHVPCFGLGYGFFPDTAFFIWAVNKFLGSDCWFSTLKGRLNASPEELATLSDDAEMVGEGYRWEKQNPGLFGGEVDTDIAIYFSRATRDFYSQVPGDYVDDYAASCLNLMRAGLSTEVTTHIPAFDRTRCLVLSSALCLSTVERRQLRNFMEAGGLVLATGPCGFFNERADAVKKMWLAEFGVNAKLDDPPRPGGFPPYEKSKGAVPIAQCQFQGPASLRTDNEWVILPLGKGELQWRPERITRAGISDAVIKVLQDRRRDAVRLKGLPESWRVRQYRDGNRLLIHALPGKIDTVLHATLKNQFINQRIVEKLRFEQFSGPLALESSVAFTQVKLHSPDLAQPREARAKDARQWEVDTADVRRYFILECFS